MIWNSPWLVGCMCLSQKGRECKSDSWRVHWSHSSLLPKRMRLHVASTRHCIATLGGDAYITTVTKISWLTIMFYLCSPWQHTGYFYISKICKFTQTAEKILTHIVKIATMNSTVNTNNGTDITTATAFVLQLPTTNWELKSHPNTDRHGIHALHHDSSLNHFFIP